MRLGVIYEATNNAYYRAIMPMRALEKRGHEVMWPANLDDDVPLRELYACDLVHCYRRLDRVEDLRRLSARGIAISYDNDDNYAASEVSDGGKGLAGTRHNRGIFRSLLKAAQLADVATTPSPVLADVYRAAGVENVVMIGNHLERAMIGFGAKGQHVGTVIGWIAGREHRVDLERIPVADALKRLLATHPELTVVTVGVRLPLQSERYRHVADVPFPRLLTVASGFDIGIAPLADIAFNHCRSNVKLKEYGAGRAAWIASPVGPYLGLGERQGGRFAHDERWFETINGLLHEPRTRRRLARCAFRWAKAETIDRHTQVWEEAFLAAIDRASPRRVTGSR